MTAVALDLLVWAWQLNEQPDELYCNRPVVVLVDRFPVILVVSPSSGFSDAFNM